MTSLYRDETIQDLSASLVGRNDVVNRWGNAISSILMLPGLRGCWPMSAIDNAGNAFDQSGNGRTLTYNGNPTYNVDNNFVPFINFDGTGDLLSRADEAGLDILGTETFIVSALRGLTFGGWFFTADVTPAATVALMGKWIAANQRSYELRLLLTGIARVVVSSNGTATAEGTSSTVTLADDTWFHFIARFVPSTELSTFVNGQEDIEVATVPASLFNGSADFTIGGRSGGTELFTGRASLCWLCAAALPDSTIIGLFEQQRVLFGV